MHEARLSGARSATSPVKIAYIFTPVEYGGAEKVNFNFLRHVDRENFDIHPVILYRPWEEEKFYVQELKRAGFEIFRIPVAKPSYAWKRRDYLRVPRCYRILHSFLRNTPFDIIHTHGYFADIIGIPISRMLGIPVISTCHGFIALDRKVSIYNSADRFLLRFAKKVIAVSEQIKKELVSSGVKEKRITVIRNCVAAEDIRNLGEKKAAARSLLGIEEGEIVVGYAGRLSTEKGVNLIIEAMALLDGTVSAKALITGDGPERKRLESLAKNSSVADRVIFSGFQKEIEKYLLAMDIFILPSFTEGTPMALLEAMSFALPVIATRVGGVPDIIEDGRNGLLVDAGDSAQLSSAIKKLYQNPRLRKEIGQEAREHIRRKYDLNSWCRRIEREYESLVLRARGLHKKKGYVAN